MDVETYSNSYIKGFKDGTDYIMYRYSKAIEEIKQKLNNVEGDISTKFVINLVESSLDGVL